ncbi:hypothetical protein [Rhodoligotrophos defluvii]|nr:hypothetical protein [Rhodoligotrophos defluvii]
MLYHSEKTARVSALRSSIWDRLLVAAAASLASWALIAWALDWW